MQEIDGKPAPCVVIFGASKSKSLHYIRLFKDAGYRTVAVGSDFYLACGTGWSIYCDKYYSITAPLCAKTEKTYINEVVEIVMKEKVDVLMQLEPRYTPSDVKANEILGKKLPSCKILAFEPATCSLFDNKMTFNAKLHELGVRAPKSKLIDSEHEFREIISSNPSKSFILKPLEFRQVDRADIMVPKDAERFQKFTERKQISKDRQFILQEKLTPPETSSCTLVIDSRIIAHNTSDQSVDRMWHNSTLPKPEIYAWIEEFLEKYDSPLTGFLTFDFMISPTDGMLYPIECNPRAHTNHMLFKRKDNLIQELTKHLVDPSYTCPVIQPTLKETYWLLREIALILQSVVYLDPGTVVERASVVLRGREAIFEWLDPLPFLVLNFVQIPGRIVANVFGQQIIWKQVDYVCGNPIIN